MVLKFADYHVNYVPFNYSKAVWATQFQFWSVFLYILLQRCKRTQLTHSWHVARVVLSFLPELKIPAVVFTLLSLHCFAAFNGNPEDDTGFWIKWRIRKHACTLSNWPSTTYHWHFFVKTMWGNTFAASLFPVSSVAVCVCDDFQSLDKALRLSCGICCNCLKSCKSVLLFYFPLPQHVVKKCGLHLDCDMDMLPRASRAKCLHEDFDRWLEKKIPGLECDSM